MIRQLLIAAAAGCALSAAFSAAPATAATATAIPDYISAAVADSRRPATDTARDVDRKPAQMLLLAGVKPGSKILEIEPAAGYFTRLFAVAVGSTGHVYAVYGAPPPASASQPPSPMAGTAQKEINDIAAQYGNVTPIGQSYSDFKVPEPVDIAWTSQNYHDFHIPRNNVDVPKFDKAVFDALKPGGIFIVLDHSAAPGAGLEAASKLHRMDEAIAKQELAAAGFKLIAESNVLRNPKDPRTAIVFDPSIRGHTDQFILKLQKPAQ
jgi:predicted methyltransferase